jgi:hypothetical protein
MIRAVGSEIAYMNVGYTQLQVETAGARMWRKPSGAP